MDRFSCASGVFEKTHWCQHQLLDSLQPTSTAAIKLSSKERSVWQKDANKEPHSANSDLPFIQSINCLRTPTWFRQTVINHSLWQEYICMDSWYRLIFCNSLWLIADMCIYYFPPKCRQHQISPEVELTYYYDSPLTEADIQCFSNWEERLSQQFAN